MVTETARNEFSMAVEKKAHVEQITHLQALTEVVAECHIDVERVPKHINKSLKDKIEAEALDAKLLKGSKFKGANIFDRSFE